METRSSPSNHSGAPHWYILANLIALNECNTWALEGESQKGE